MWLLVKTAWRNLSRQRRRTAITVSAMALSLWLAIPTWGLTEGLTREMLRGITEMELGHLQLHDPAYPKGRALQSTLERPEHLLAQIRGTKGVVAAAPRVHGYALASHDERLGVRLVGLSSEASSRGEDVLFGRPMDAKAPWQADTTLACEALVSREEAAAAAIVVGTLLTPDRHGKGGRCERIQVVGLLKTRLAPDAHGAAGPSTLITLGLLATDLREAFGDTPNALDTLVRHSGAVSVLGVDPEAERQVTFMAQKVVEGRYLGKAPRSEVVIGLRLAQTMHLKIGDKLFLQAASLDNTRGTFYEDFEVVGLYRTGVDMLDRTRIFIHLKDAQTLMALGDRVHEIAVKTTDARRPHDVVKRLRRGVSTRLRITRGSDGRRAGSRPLPAPMTIYEPQKGDGRLLVPYDLKRRFDDIPGVRAVASRVYAETRVGAATALTLPVEARDLATMRSWLPEGARSPDPCTLLLPAPLATSHGLKEDESLIPWGAATGDDTGCPRVTVLLGTAAMPPVRAIALASPEGAPGAEDTPHLEAGNQRLLRPAPRQALRLVGVEPSYEQTVSGLHRRVTEGRYLAVQGEDTKEDVARSAEADAPAALLSARAARSLGVKPGGLLVMEGRDDEGRPRLQAARLVGLLGDDGWPEGLPHLVLPYFAAQAVDSPRLNARAHELVLVLTDDADLNAVTREASARLAPLLRPWQEIQPDMAKLLQTQDIGMAIMLFIIFAIAAMTVMNTMLMAVWERTREFGVLKALGMRPSQVFGLIVIETVFLAIIAGIIGGGGGIALNHWAVVQGLDLSAWTGGFTYQGTFIDPVWRSAHTVKAIAVPILMVQLVCLGVSFYPAWRAGRLKPVVALRHHG